MRTLETTKMNNNENGVMELYSLIPLPKEKADLFIKNCLDKSINLHYEEYMPNDVAELAKMLKEKGFKNILDWCFSWADTNEGPDFWNDLSDSDEGSDFWNDLDLDPKFKIGDKVKKPKGYSFDGIIVSIFQTTKGETRIVAELENNGMLHIFNENQLELR